MFFKQLLVMVVLTLLAALVVGNVAAINEVLSLRQSLVWMPGDAVINLGNCTWDSMPAMLRENLAKRFPSTKLNKKDCEDLAAFYKKLADEYKGPITLTLEGGE